MPTPAELFDLMAEKFGVGAYDETTCAIPYYRVRMTEISKVRSMMRSRRVSETELAIAIDYAIAHRSPITETWQVFNLVPEAMAEHFANERSRRRREEAVSAEVLATAAFEAGDDMWATRFLNTAPDELAFVAEEYRAWQEAH